jgi:hypothetical protein
LPQNKTFDGQLQDSYKLPLDIKLLNHNQDLAFDTHYKTAQDCENIAYNSVYNKEVLSLNHVKVKSIMISYGKTNSYFSATDLHKHDIVNQIQKACELNMPDTYFTSDNHLKVNEHQKFINNTHLVIDYQKEKEMH